MTSWITLFKPGDWVVSGAGAVFCAMSFALAWQGGQAEKAVVRLGGEIFSELDLSRNRTIDVPGPLGTTTIRVDRRRVRVVSDPGIHQYCVRQGWLERAGEIAICAPNQVSIQIVGGKEAYDSLSY